MAQAEAQAEAGDPRGGDEAENTLTIEQLSAESGMTVRNIRSHRARGLLPPPEVRDRIGFYGPEHLSRLKLIQDLQADGFNLKGIQRLLESAPATQQFLHFKRALSAPMADEEPKVFTQEELAERFGTADEPDVLRKALEVGALSDLGDGRFEARSPSLLEAAEEVVRAGVPIEQAVRVMSKVRDACREVAKGFTRLFLEEVWKPFEEEGYPDERWPEIVESLERLRPVSMQVLASMYQMTMADETDRAFGRELERLSKTKR